MRIITTTANIVRAPVDAIVNSANGYLVLGTSIAGRIRTACGYLPARELPAYWRLVARLPADIAQNLKRVTWKRKWRPTTVQRDCVRAILRNRGRQIAVGTAVVTPSGEIARKYSARAVIHAVAMTYRWERGVEIERRRATEKSITAAVTAALRLAAARRYRSVAIPLFGVSKGDVTAAASRRCIDRAIARLGDTTSVQTVYIEAPRRRS